MPKVKSAKSARRNGKPSDATRIRQLRKRVQELEQQVERYRTALIKRLPPPPKHLRLTRKQMKEMEEFRPTFHEYVEQLKGEMKAES
jgi:hypothetical protein